MKSVQGGAGAWSFGLVGWPVEHSFSPPFFRDLFAREGLPHSYTLWPVEPHQRLADALELFCSDPQVRGFNVTLPYKVDIMAHLHHLAPSARAVGAVNTVLVEHMAGRPKLSGFNTDMEGFGQLLAMAWPKPALLQRVLVLGTGGSSRAVAAALKLAHPGVELRWASRQAGPNRAEWGSPQLLEWQQWAQLLVNTTPLGMNPHPDAAPALAYDRLQPRQVLIDLVYTPEETRFMRLGRQQGCAAWGGLLMLHSQALAAWKIWQQGKEAEWGELSPDETV